MVLKGVDEDKNIHIFIYRES